MQEGEALARLHTCAGLSEPSLHLFDKHQILYASSFEEKLHVSSQKSNLLPFINWSLTLVKFSTVALLECSVGYNKYRL